MHYNIGKRFNILSWLLLIFLTTASQQVRSQTPTDSQLVIIKKWKEYRKLIKEDRTKWMVEVKTMVPGIVYDLRYASTNNFMHRRMYPEGTNITFLRLPAAAALSKVQSELNEKGLGLKIFDAYRPYAVTVKFWELVKDERYVANPAKGSGHNRGIAVDLTIIDLHSGEELNMGTGFDNFTDSAHHTFKNLPANIQQNRDLLKSTMEKYGFKEFETEWWHYFLANGDRFEVLDLGFKKLNKKFKHL
jgi:D-alanyl-D-alanine dipeptidase